MTTNHRLDQTNRPTWAGFSVVAGVVGTLLAASPASAAESEPTEFHQVLEKPNFNPSPAIALRWDREAEFSRLALTDAWQLDEDSATPARGPLPQLGRFDLRQNVWQATPYAATTMASAVAALATRGIPVMRETREFRTVRTHRLGCYFKGRGGGLVWRLEF